jgi:hypothetical protein
VTSLQKIRLVAVSMLVALGGLDVLDAAAQGVIRGRVVRAGSEEPLRRVLIEITAADGDHVRQVLSGVDGRYEVRDLPRGAYALRASRNGFAPMYYGQRYPFQLVRRTVTPDKVAENVDFVLTPTGVISGVVLDDGGEPLAGATVAAARARMVNGRRTLALVSQSRPTNDLGEFRISGLPEGEYIIEVAPRNGNLAVDGVVEYLPTYYPGTNSTADAQRVRVRFGEEVPGLVLPVTPGRTASIYGMVTGATSAEPPRVTLGHYFLGGATWNSASTGQGGEFRFRHLPPGDYTLEVSQKTPTGTLNAAADVRLVGRDVSVTLDLRAPAILRGQVRFDATASSAMPTASSITLIAESARADRVISSEARPRDDGTFEIPVKLPAPTTIRARVPDGWAVRSIRLNGKDLVGPVSADGDLSGLEITLRNRLSTVTGAVVDVQGTAAADATVLIMPDPRAQPARVQPDAVRTALADRAGTFTIRDVLPGQYVAVALDYVAEGSENDREWLARLLAVANPVSVTSQELRLDLRLARTP